MASPRLQTTSPALQRQTKSTTNVILMGVAGAAAGVVAKSATAPLERVKMLLQVQAMAAPPSTVVKSGTVHPHRLRLQYRGGIFGTMAEVARAEGLVALFQGNGANCVRIAPAYAVRFGTNDAIKDWVRRPEQNPKEMDLQQLVTAGTIAGIMQTMVTHPLETIRSRMSVGSSLGDKHGRYSGMVDCARKCMQTEGLGGLYKGFAPALAMSGPYVGAQMTFYELFKRSTPVSDAESDGANGTAAMWRLVAGGAAGMAAQTLTFPADTLRRRLQLNGQGGTRAIYSGAWDCVRQILTKEGVLGFYQGCGTNLVRAVPGVAIQFAVYDQLKAMVA